MTVRNVKGVARGNKGTDNYHSCMEHFNVFQLIVLVLRSQICCFGFTLAALIGIARRHIREPFSQKKL